MRQVQARGCLPVLVTVVVVVVLMAGAVTVSVAVAVVAAAAGLLVALVRMGRGLGRAREVKTPAAHRRAADVTIDAEVIEPSKGSGDRPTDRLT